MSKKLDVYHSHKDCTMCEVILEAQVINARVGQSAAIEFLNKKLGNKDAARNFTVATKAMKTHQRSKDGTLRYQTVGKVEKAFGSYLLNKERDLRFSHAKLKATLSVKGLRASDYAVVQSKLKDMSGQLNAAKTQSVKNTAEFAAAYAKWSEAEKRNTDGSVTLTTLLGKPYKPRLAKPLPQGMNYMYQLLGEKKPGGYGMQLAGAEKMNTLLSVKLMESYEAERIIPKRAGRKSTANPKEIVSFWANNGKVNDGDTNAINYADPTYRTIKPCTTVADKDGSIFDMLVS